MRIRFVYVFVLLAVGLVFALQARTEHAGRAAIDRAAAAAIYPAVERACIERNDLRDRIWTFYAASSGAPSLDREDGRALLEYEDCPDLAEESVQDYFYARR